MNVALLAWLDWRGWFVWRDWLGCRWLGRLVGLSWAGQGEVWGENGAERGVGLGWGGREAVILQRALVILHTNCNIAIGMCNITVWLGQLVGLSVLGECCCVGLAGLAWLAWLAWLA